MRIGVLGGSFDPVHIAHLTVAEAAAAQLGLDEVRFVPTAIQPFKPEGPHADAEHRVAMLRLALNGRPGLVLDLREVERGGISYTVDTLTDLRREFPSDELFLLVGADTACDLPRWRDVDKLGELAQIVAMSRAGGPPPDLAAITNVLMVPSIDVSASAIRQAARHGKVVAEWVPASVAEYIRTHQVYHSED
jgi:nicotinate-nucleotide adenylyltransferase